MLTREDFQEVMESPPVLAPGDPGTMPTMEEAQELRQRQRAWGLNEGLPMEIVESWAAAEAKDDLDRASGGMASAAAGLLVSPPMLFAMLASCYEMGLVTGWQLCRRQQAKR